MLETTEQEAVPAARSGGRGPGHYEIRWRNPERELLDYVSALWRRKHVLLALTALCASLGLVWALSKPNTYVSRATLLVHGSGGAGSAADAAASVLGTGRILPDQVVTAVQIVGSRPVLEGVVDRLGVAEVLRPYEPVRLQEKSGLIDRVVDALHEVQVRWLAPAGMDLSRYPRETLRAAALETLEENLSVLPATRGTTIELAYLHTSPEGAARVLHAVVEESIERYGAIVTPPEGKDWLDHEVAEAAAEEEEARAALEAFAEEHGTTDLGPEIETLTESLTTLESQRRLARMKRDEHRQVLERLRAQIEDVEPQLREVVQEVFSTDPVRQEVQQKLLELRALRAAEEGAESAGASPRLARLDRQIETLEQQLAELGESAPQRTVAVRPNPRYVSLDADIRAREIDLVGVETQIPVIEAALQEVRAGLERRGRLQQRVERMYERLAKASARHDQLLEIGKTYEVSHELDRRGLTNLRVVSDAAVPRSKQGPRRGRLLLAAALGGLMLGVTCVLVAVRLDRRLRRGRDVMIGLGRGDVVAMPHVQGTALRRFAEARRRGWE